MQNTSGADKRERKKQIKYKEETDIFLADSELGEAKRLVRSQGASDLIELGQLRPGVQPEAVAAGSWQRANEVRWGSTAIVCERRRSTWHRLANTHAMGSWEGSAAACASSGPEQGGLTSVERAQQWCWMALEVNNT